MIDLPFVIEAACTWALTGLIWTIQLVHYPLFRLADENRWREFHAEHARRISLIVMALMPAELILAGRAALLAEGDTAIWRHLGLGLVIAVWGVTAAVQVPQHGRLGAKKDEVAIRALVLGNWPRTILWTARAILLGWLLLG